MDLTKTFPVSVREKMHGIVQLRRTIDKGKAKAHGNPGEYNFDCPMDRAVFDFLGMDGNALFDVIKNAKGDAEIENYVVPFIQKKSPAEIEAWNESWLTHGPDPGSDAEKYFLQLRSNVAPDRTDVKSWADLLDLDEKRPVPVAA
ncbi:MAG: DUF5069 domain-containing protein [Candidatus Velthaea sp.]